MCGIAGHLAADGEASDLAAVRRMNEAQKHRSPDAVGTWQESHFSWRLRSVLWAIVLYAVTFPFFLLGLLIFNPAWVLISIWFLYRIVRGMVAMNKDQAIQS